MIDSAATTDVKVMFIATSVSYVPLEPRIIRNYNLPPGVKSKYLGDANWPGWYGPIHLNLVNSNVSLKGLVFVRQVPRHHTSKNARSATKHLSTEVWSLTTRLLWLFTKQG
jgi:hypothetical protein